MPIFKGNGCKSSPKKAIKYILDDKKAELAQSGKRLKHQTVENIITSS